jgi:hypothetical protein
LTKFPRSSPEAETQVALDNLHPKELPLDRPIDAVNDVAGREGDLIVARVPSR